MDSGAPFSALEPASNTPRVGGEIAEPGPSKFYHRMQTDRLEAFSDGALAIIVTIMVLEIKVPHGSDVSALKLVLPVFLTCVLSFLYLGIYWKSHHHLLKAFHKVNGALMWANLLLFF